MWRGDCSVSATVFSRAAVRRTVYTSQHPDPQEKLLKRKLSSIFLNDSISGATKSKPFGGEGRQSLINDKESVSCPQEFDEYTVTGNKA